MKRVPRVRVACVLAVGAVLLAACSDSGSSARIDGDGLAGTWTSGKGAALTIEKTPQSFSATGLKVDASAYPDCTGELDDGGWEFYDEHGLTSPAAGSGTQLVLAFPAGRGRQSSSCSVDVDVRKKSGKLMLCISDYADSTCDSGIYFTKQDGTPAK
ncbi:hypothetical protein ACWERV_13145 [Streptomyces sp. NPDC004031]